MQDNNTLKLPPHIRTLLAQNLETYLSTASGKWPDIAEGAVDVIEASVSQAFSDMIANAVERKVRGLVSSIFG